MKKVPSCIDIDECTKKGVCPENAECLNSPGSYTCNCFDGFIGDYCVDVDECNSTNSCDENAKCLNTDGSYKCGCKDGYYGNGESCFPGRCPEANCPTNQKCVSPTAIDCECKKGFRLDAFSDCLDIDECVETKCYDQAECLNTIGSYICKPQSSTTAASTLAPTELTTKVVTVKTTVFTTQTSLTTKRPIPTSYQYDLLT